ncbi:MAG: class I SAM-dependent methyltransferase [Acidobacteriota bacterium]
MTPNLLHQLDLRDPETGAPLAAADAAIGDDGIWRALSPALDAATAAGRAHYRAARFREGWSMGDLHDDEAIARRVRALPMRDVTGRHPAIWAARLRSYRALVKRLVMPMAQKRMRGLTLLDLGAGSGWLAGRLATGNHRAVAVDLDDHPIDGLGAVRHWQLGAGHLFGAAPENLAAVQAHFDHLPFADGQFDLVVWNGAFHYAADGARTLAEGRRMLAPGGRLVILDSPTFGSEAAGETMLAEQRAQHGGESHLAPRIGFVTPKRLAGYDRAVRWRRRFIFYDLRWHLRPLQARLLGRRPPMRFWLWIGQVT